MKIIFEFNNLNLIKYLNKFFTWIIVTPKFDLSTKNYSKWGNLNGLREQFNYRFVWTFNLFNDTFFNIYLNLNYNKQYLNMYF